MNKEMVELEVVVGRGVEEAERDQSIHGGVSKQKDVRITNIKDSTGCRNFTMIICHSCYS